MLIQGAELEGVQRDVRCEGGVITAIAENLSPLRGESVLPADGGALLPGLHDHHIHLYAQAAAAASIPCGPPLVNNREELAASLGSRPGKGWLRGIDYHEAVAGALDRQLLDSWVGDRPLRIQHRSGKMWYLNSPGVEALGLDRADAPADIERDASGKATGRLFRMDAWLRVRLARDGAPDLTPLSTGLAARGVTGVTDASASNTAGDMAHFCDRVAAGELRQRLRLMGDATVEASSHPQVSLGAVKILLDDHRLPDYGELLERIETGHRQQRGVAIHCVTQTELVFALTALTEVGPQRVDRIEHASVSPDEVLPLMRDTGVTVVTQPGFIYGRGDRYRADVPPAEQGFLYRCRGFLEAGIPLAGSSDAPYGSTDPWLAMRAAVQRRTREGHVIGADEALSPEQALALYTGEPAAPGRRQRRVEVGALADLCLLNRPWAEARQRLNSEDVVATLRGGEFIYRSTRGAAEID